MRVIEADTPVEGYLDALGYLRRTRELKDVHFHVKNMSNPFAWVSHWTQYLPTELQEAADIVNGEPCPNGMRYRYFPNSGHIRTNNEISWQYSQDTAHQIRGIVKLNKKQPGRDKNFIILWRPERDLYRYVQYCRFGMERELRPRTPCGIVWHYRARRGGWSFNAMYRSIWIDALLHDIRIPCFVGHYLGKPMRDYSNVILTLSGGMSHKIDADHLDHIIRFETDTALPCNEYAKPYLTDTKADWIKKDAAVEAARGGHFQKAITLCKQLPKDSLYRDWTCNMLLAEWGIQRKLAQGLKNYGYKEALITKARHVSSESTDVMELVDLSTERGPLQYHNQRDAVRMLLRRNRLKDATKVLAKHTSPEIRASVLASAMTSAKMNESLRKISKKLGTSKLTANLF